MIGCPPVAQLARARRAAHTFRSPGRVVARSRGACALPGRRQNRPPPRPARPVPRPGRRGRSLQEQVQAIEFDANPYKFAHIVEQ